MLQSNSVIDCFDGDYAFLSNFYPCRIVYEGIEYQNSEAAFQAQKTLDIDIRKNKFSNATPKDAKRFGRKIELRPDWNDIRVDIMRNIVNAKFTQNPDLMNKLLETDDAELLEGNWWKDTFWGICNGEGENNLGKILMEIRDIYKKRG